MIVLPANNLLAKKVVRRGDSKTPLKRTKPHSPGRGSLEKKKRGKNQGGKFPNVLSTITDKWVFFPGERTNGYRKKGSCSTQGKAGGTSLKKKKTPKKTGGGSTKREGTPSRGEISRKSACHQKEKRTIRRDITCGKKKARRGGTALKELSLPS